MIHFQIPRNSPTLFQSIKYNIVDSNNSLAPSPSPLEEKEGSASTIAATNNLAISNSLAYYLTDIKQRIDHQEQEWDVYKRYTNPYEYIHTNVPGKRKSVSKYKPLSRSYFKMIELIHFFRLLDNGSRPSKIAIRSFHLAEGPGGFIEALVHCRNCKSDEYIGMTILDDVSDPNIPAWKKSQNFLRENPNVVVETGADRTGDILSLANFDYCCQKYGGSMDVITGDGGFDFSVDFNGQESHIANLLFGQVAYALCMQKRGGCFILKVFDCFMQHTLDILAILSSFYEKVYLTKPQTSRYANSEKYVVCKGFLYSNSDGFLPKLRETFESMVSSSSFSEGVSSTSTSTSTLRFLTVPLSLLFLSRIEEYNAVFGQQQIENIHYTFLLMNSCKEQYNQRKMQLRTTGGNTQDSNVFDWSNTRKGNGETDGQGNGQGHGSSALAAFRQEDAVAEYEHKHKYDKVDTLIKLNTQRCIHWCIKHNISHHPVLGQNTFLHLPPKNGTGREMN